VAVVEPTRLGELLRHAREQAGLSQEAAAEAIGLNRVVLSYYEGGQRQPALPAASALARLYGLSLAELLEEGEAQLEPTEVLFRVAPAELSDRARAGMGQFSSLVRAYVDLVEDLGGELPGKETSPFPAARPKAGHREAARLARDVREYLGLGHGPIGDHLFEIADDVALVFRLPLGEHDGSSPSGFFYNHRRAGFCIAVNSEMSLGRQVFTLAHELAHAFFHSQGADAWISFPGAPSARERFADLFAGQLLVPEDALASAADELGTWEELADPIVAVHLQRHFGVSYATLVVRLRQENLISEDVYQELRQISPSRLALALGYEVNPADFGDYRIHPLDRFPGRLLRLFRRAVGDGLVTRGDAAETLGVSLEEVLHLLERPRVQASELRALEEIEGGARLPT
jgi:Zn-dependent peptidase ImmA (M78 family)/transcriptional regulator with XRE-family HTH domain